MLYACKLVNLFEMAAETGVGSVDSCNGSKAAYRVDYPVKRGKRQKDAVRWRGRDVLNEAFYIRQAGQWAEEDRVIYRDDHGLSFSKQPSQSKLFSFHSKPSIPR